MSILARPARKHTLLAVQGLSKILPIPEDTTMLFLGPNLALLCLPDGSFRAISVVCLALDAVSRTSNSLVPASTVARTTRSARLS
jgi:hypothetical protein